MKQFNENWDGISRKNPNISEASASSKIITLPNQMGTIKVVKSTTARGEPEWTFEYQGFKG